MPPLDRLTRKASDAAREAYAEGYRKGVEDERKRQQRTVVAHLVGGPKAGEQRLTDGERIVVAKAHHETYYAEEPVDLTPAFAPDYGIYRRDRQLVGKPYGSNEWIYIWQGWS